MAKLQKLFILLMVVLSASFVFAGGAEEQLDPDEEVTIDYSFWGNPEAIGVEEDILAEYHSIQSQINVAPVVSGYQGYHDMLLTQLAGGSGPDVMRVDSYYFSDFAELGALRPIDDLVERDNIDMSAYYELGVIENTYQGELYGLPWGTAPLYMFINLDVFEEHGVDLPDNDWTLEDFENLARELTTGSTYGWGMTTTEVSGILPFVWAMGGDLFSDDLSEFALDEPEAVAALDFLASLAADDIMPDDGLVGDAELLNEMFVNGELAMRMGSAAEILTLQAAGMRFEVHNMPTGEVLDTTVNKSNIIGINANSSNVEAAWEFLKFLRAPGERGEELYMEAQRMPPNVDDARLWEIYAGAGDYPSDVETTSLAINETYGRLMPLRPGWLEIEDLIMSEVQGVILGEVSAQEAMSGIAGDAQDILDR